MRILLVADLHYTLRQFDWVVDAARDVDLVVLAGDHLDVASSVPLDAQCVVVGRYVELLRGTAPVVVSSGNHDLTGPDHAGEQAALWLDALRAENVWTDGDTLDIGATRITVCPWWDGDAGRGALDARLRRDAKRRPDTWIWVYHWPPTDSPTCWTGRQHYGDDALTTWIAELAPDAVLTGHVHQPPFRPDGAWADRVGTTWVFNPGRQTGPVPAHIELDLAAGIATWSSQLGREEQPLDDPPAPRRVF